MTGLLDDVMHDRADSLAAPDLDVAAIVRDGDRRVARRRARTGGLAGLAAAAAAVVAVGSGSLLDGRGAPAPDGARDIVADGTDAAPRTLSWVEGSTLHRTGEPDADLGASVRAWVWAGDDVVLTDAQRRVRVWSGDALDVVGVTTAGDADDPELVADGTRAAWADAERGLVVLDTATGDWSATSVPGSASARVTAIDATTVYAVDSRGVIAWDFRSDTVDVLDPSGRDVVVDAEDGTLLSMAGDRRAHVSGPGRDLTLTTDSFAALAPDGAHVVSESDDTGILLDTATGGRVTLDTGYEWALPFQWLDDDDVAVLAFSGLGGKDEQPVLLPCSVSTGACTTGQELPPSFQLPIGVHLES